MGQDKEVFSIKLLVCNCTPSQRPYSGKNIFLTSAIQIYLFVINLSSNLQIEHDFFLVICKSNAWYTKKTFKYYYMFPEMYC